MATFDADLQREFQKLREIDENLSSMNARRRTFDRERGVGGDREAAGDDAPATRRSTTTDDGGGRRSIDDSRHTRITVTGLGVRRRITTEDDDGDRRRSLTVVSDPNSSRRIVMGGGRTDSSFALKRRRDPADEDVEEDSERPPKRSLASTVVMPTIETKSRAAAIEELKGSEKKEVSQRNRRLFGNLLMGTLKRFQSDEKKVSTQEKVQAEKQQEVERRLEEQRQQEREAALNKRKELLNARRQQEILIKQLQRKKALTQYAEQRKEHYRRLRNFIQTSTKPAIFYLPAKHTLRTLELQKETAKMLDELIEKRQKELESNLAPGEEKAGGEGETGATVKSFVARRNSREEDDDEDDYSDNERDVSRASGANGEEEAEVDEGKVEKVVVVGEEENSKDEPMDAKDDEASR